MRNPPLTRVVLGVSAALVCATSALAQQYPTKPVTLVSPYGAGGNADLPEPVCAIEWPHAYLSKPVARRGNGRWLGRFVVRYTKWALASTVFV